MPSFHNHPNASFDPTIYTRTAYLGKIDQTLDTARKIQVEYTCATMKRYSSLDSFYISYYYCGLYILQTIGC